MSNPTKFVDELKKFSNKIGGVGEKTISRIRSLNNKESENMSRIESISVAAKGIYIWL
jgi:hypothetical protein